VIAAVRQHCDCKVVGTARLLRDFLVVGVVSNTWVRQHKGGGRPVAPERERLRMVARQRGAGLVTLKHPGKGQCNLVPTLRPDVLVATEETNSTMEIAELGVNYCGRAEKLHRMDAISTSAQLRTGYFELATVLTERLPNFLHEVISEVAGEL
jgi:bifunctional ADP-heptose synthase (sugar kinase/adenylyltransferase)